MTTMPRRRLPWTLVGLVAALVAGRVALGAYTGSLTDNGGYFYAAVSFFLVGTFVLSGTFIVSRQPRNTIGWILIGIALMGAFALFVADYATYGLRTRPGSLPAATWAAWFDRWDIVPALASFIPLFLLFPDGRLPSRRWRPVLWVAVGAIALATLSFALTPGPMTGAFADLAEAHVVNPLGLGRFGGVVAAVSGITGAVTLVSAFAAVASLVVRFRSRTGDERQQVKWLAFVGVAFVVVFVAIIAVTSVFPENSHANDVVGDVGFGVLFVLLAVGIPAACAIAVLRYRLYDIDVVINKTVVFGSLAAFITAVYVAIVVGIGAVIGSSGKPNLGLSILATAVVAVAFQPARERVQRFANRLVYGDRATPYEVLAGFVRRVGGTYAAEEVLPRMARALAEATGAERAGVWLRLDGTVRPEAFWPETEHPVVQALRLADGKLPPLPDASLSLAVRDRGDLLGALSVTKRPGEPLTSTEEKLVADLAGQAGLVLRNVGLTEELLVRLEEIERSRARIVTAEEEERQRIEERIREGTRRELEAIRIALDGVLTRPPGDAALVRLEEIAERTTRALESLRDVARGIYPPVLADKGLVAALEAQARRSAVPVTVDATEIERFDRDVESAIYFCCTEAMRRAEHAGATSVRLSLRTDAHHVVFDVEMDAVLPDALPDVEDRVAALDGTIAIRTDDRGTLIAATRVSGRLPANALVGAAS